MVFWWRVRLYLSLLRSVDCFNLQRVFSVRREAAAPAEVCSVGCKCAGMWPLFLACLGSFALVVVAGEKQGGSWTRQVSVAPFKVRLLWEKNRLFCIEECWDGERTWLCFVPGFYSLLLLTQTCKMTSMKCPIPLLQAVKSGLFKDWRIQTGVLHSLLKMHISVHFVAWECRLLFSRGQWWIWSSLMFHLSLSLYYQVVSLTEYHRRIDALNSEDLRSLCKRLQVP